MIQKYRISQGLSLHISQLDTDHIYYNNSIEIQAHPEALKEFYFRMFEIDKQSVCNCDDSLNVKGK